MTVTTTRPTLYDLTTDLTLFTEALEPDENGEIHATEDDLERYFGLQSATVEKAENTVKFIRNLETEADGIDAEIKRLTARKRTCGNIVKRVKEYALWCMQKAGMRSIGDKPFSLNRQRNSRPAVIVPEGLDLSTWEDRFKVVKVEPDKKEIYEAWKADEPIPANVEIVEGEHIRVR